MKIERADGPKTELIGVSQRMQQSIEEMIASVSRGIGDCMENARDKPESPYDNMRTSERNDAVRMVSSTAELLASTEQTIDSISQEVGYQNPFVFSNAFTKWIGWRPSEYRRKKFNKA